MNQIAKISPGSIFKEEQINLIKQTVCKGATDHELSLFLYQCERTNLDPLARQIYAIKRRTYDTETRAYKDVMSIQTSIDGFRLIAERSGKYAGQVGPFWCGTDGIWREVWLSPEPPSAARVGILRHDFKEPAWGVARFDAYKQTVKDGGLSKMWKLMGDVMIAKCAESLGLRKAFPQELSGLYTSDEMAQDTHDVIPAEIIPIQAGGQQESSVGEIGGNQSNGMLKEPEATPKNTAIKEECIDLALEITRMIASGLIKADEARAYGGLESIQAAKDAGDVYALRQAVLLLREYVSVKNQEMLAAS